MTSFDGICAIQYSNKYICILSTNLYYLLQMILTIIYYIKYINTNYIVLILLYSRNISNK